ncbi:hypothetical protein Prudu_018651 [Prunus dulcis]|uniref:Uncharacterized protein n=1 Tax=Prunus dulcis TaxID=3755 RepID=A0A4Y1RSW0_PRUDU|nr:hypothetical protein Prudu_018651 [Prunus dulcis]
MWAPGARQDFKRRPLRDRSSSDHQVGLMSTDIQSDYSSISALDLPREFRDARTTWCPETCQDCGSADFMSPRPARIADQADYGPLHPARATRVDLVSSRNLPAGQADHSPLISPVCGSVHTKVIKGYDDIDPRFIMIVDNVRKIGQTGREYDVILRIVNVKEFLKIV